MILYSFCTFVALSWLCYRLYKFVTIPVIKIVSTLKIGTPPATKVSIDKISHESITVHWENEPLTRKRGKRHCENISHFLLYLNNLQVAIFPNSPNFLYTCCSITGLESGEEYQLDFVTVNNMGFINKLPSLYCMTKAGAKLASPSTSNGRRNGKWRKNTLTSTATLTDSASNFCAPAYANLTSLKDLESYSIEDLKRILVCAQEDLHDVLSQQSSLLQDFQESKLQLDLEIDNLKSYWSHEIDLRKSLRSNIKSLENSKLLSDLKLEKIDKNIDQANAKILKMQRDMENWSHQDQEQLNKAALKESYEKNIAQINDEIDALNDKIKQHQHEVISQEEKNKELNSLKKSASSSHPKQTNISSESQDLPLPLPALLKRLNDLTMDKSGLLSSNGEEFLSKLNPNSPVVKLVRDQLKIDQELDSRWKSKRNKMSKRIETLQAMFNEISNTNRRLRSNLIVQPYSNQNPEISSTETPCDSNSNSNVNLAAIANGNNIASKSNSSANLNEMDTVLNSPPLSQRSAIDNFGGQAVPISSSHSVDNPDINPQLVLHNPSTYSSNDPVPSELDKNAFSSGHPNTASLIPNTNQMHQVFPWGSEQQQQQQVELEQAFEYDNASHLISGLQNIMYDETEYPESISNYSKGFTTDQLDNYWTNQTLSSNSYNVQSHPKDFQPSYVNNDGYAPVLPLATNLRPQSPMTPPNLAPSQSLLAATLAEPSMANFGASSLPIQHHDSFPAVESPVSNQSNGNHMNSALRHSVLPANGSEMPMPVGEEGSIHATHQQDPQDPRGHLQSPSFNFMWHPPSSNPSSAKSETKHVRTASTASNGSSNSTWGKLNWRNWSPQTASQAEDVVEENESPPPLPRSASHHHKDPVPPLNTSGRRMSRLLSRSGMNSIFKLPSHEEKK